MTDQAPNLQNHFLIAMPQLLDPNFSGTITYLCEHNEHGAMGIVINRPTELSLQDILEQLEIPLKSDDQILYAGGPVQLERGFVLHTDQREWQSSMNITPQIRLTSSKDILSAIANGEGPEQFLIALGYAGWGAGQLEQELADNAWLTCRANQEVMFNT
ncbi:MAG: YqgE/AlgH family protein, partial [Oleiphilaceae bacterium]|nr:YqgE/AlgH family protein [Oleiphilaceae bacterium]